MSQAGAWAPPGWCTQWRRRRGLQTGAERRLPALDTSAALVAVRAKMAPQAADGNGPAAGRLAVAYPRSLTYHVYQGVEFTRVPCRPERQSVPARAQHSVSFGAITARQLQALVRPLL